MGLKDKLTESYTKNFFNKFGDRLTQAQGKVISVKVEEKVVLWIFHKLTATILVKPDRSRNIVNCVYKKNKWFKKPNFITISQGHTLLIQGLKPKKDKKHKNTKESLEVLNIMNFTNKQQLVPVEGDAMDKVKKAQKIKYRER